MKIDLHIHTNLVSITRDLDEQTNIIKKYMLEYIDGVECWHSRHDVSTTAHYMEFVRKHSLVMTGGSDCHQKPIIMGTLALPDFVAEQFKVVWRIKILSGESERSEAT